MPAISLGNINRNFFVFNYKIHEPEIVYDLPSIRRSVWQAVEPPSSSWSHVWRVGLQFAVVFLSLSFMCMSIYNHPIFEVLLKVGKACVSRSFFQHPQTWSPGISRCPQASLGVFQSCLQNTERYVLKDVLLSRAQSCWLDHSDVFINTLSKHVKCTCILIPLQP